MTSLPMQTAMATACVLDVPKKRSKSTSVGTLHVFITVATCADVTDGRLKTTHSKFISNTI